MRALLKPGYIIVTADGAEDRDALRAFLARATGHAFRVESAGGTGFALRDLGPEEEACRAPINVTSDTAEERLRPIGNLSRAPLVLDGRAYASVEGFWQGLKLPSEEDRLRVAALHGIAAKRAGDDAPRADSLVYEGRTIRVGRPEHWTLMHRACLAKFTQDETTRRALLATGTRPLQHRVRCDSETIPGAVMADIWMRVRARLVAEAEPRGGASDEAGPRAP
jgi:predicted NAD-dependent protein-ADP-ribosyltransferase YbiA (DUF1768 family)